MRRLLDECVPARLRRAFPTHTVSTVVLEGWSGIKNGALLALAATRFDAFITVDKNLPYQQNASNLPLPVFVLDVASNELAHLQALLPDLEQALARIAKGSCTVISGKPERHQKP